MLDITGSWFSKNDNNWILEQPVKYDKEDFQDLFFDKKPDIFLRIKSPGGEVSRTTEDKKNGARLIFFSKNSF